MSPLLVRQAVVSGVQMAQEISFANVLDSRGFRRNLLLLLAAGVVVSCWRWNGRGGSAPYLVNRNVLLGTRPGRKDVSGRGRVGKDGAVVFPRGEDWTQVVSVRPTQVIPPPSISIPPSPAVARRSL